MQAHTNTQKKKILVRGYVHEGKSTVIKYLQPLLKDEYELVESQVFPPYKAQDVLPRKIAIHSELSQSNDHYHLIVFVMLATSIKRGENYLPEGTWLSENTHVYEEVGMKANDIKLVCFAEGGFMEYQYYPLHRDETGRTTIPQDSNKTEDTYHLWEDAGFSLIIPPERRGFFQG